MGEVKFIKNSGEAILKCSELYYGLYTSKDSFSGKWDIVEINSDDRFEFLKKCYNAGVSECYLNHIINKRIF